MSAVTIERCKQYKALGKYAVVLTDGRLGEGRTRKEALIAAQCADAINVKRMA